MKTFPLPLAALLPQGLALRLALVLLGGLGAAQLLSSALGACTGGHAALFCVPALRLALVLLTCWLAVRTATRPLDALARAADERLRVLAGISHDLQTPIARMRLRLELMDDPHWAAFDGDLRQLQALVREGLGYARTLHGELEPACTVDLDRLADSIACDYRDDGASVAWRGAIGIPLLTRPRALQRILCNLVDNALKYAGGADIVLGHDDQGCATIRVLDRGPGIPPELLETVFEPFQRLEASERDDPGGSGLGLAIARQLAATLPAALTLHAREGGGLEARLTLAPARP